MYVYVATAARGIGERGEGLFVTNVSQSEYIPCIAGMGRFLGIAMVQAAEQNAVKLIGGTGAIKLVIVRLETTY